MPAFEASLTEVSVLVDDLVAADPPPQSGPAPALAASEVVTIALISSLGRFASTCASHRFAETHLRACVPTLPHRTQFLRQARRHAALIARVAVTLGAHLAGQAGFEMLDGGTLPTRNRKRRGRRWMPGEMSLGFSNRLGFFEGAKVLTCVSPTGALTGFGLAPAHHKDRTLAETFLAQRHLPQPALPSAGRAASGADVADQGFGGAADGAGRRPTKRSSSARSQPVRRSRVWPKPLRRWLISQRQPIEAVHRNLIETGRLDRLRPHSVTGALVAVAATAALHNAGIWLNRRLGRPDLATAEVFGG